MSKVKKYKLRKWYPSLPKDWKDRVGNVYMEQHPTSRTFSRNGDCLSPILDASELRNNPEFWEEVVEKNYEILSFKDLRSINDERIVKLRADGKYWFPDDNVHDGVTEKQMLHEGACVDLGDFVVHAVRRKSDGEVFTIGDKILYKHGNIERVIDRFILTSSNLVKVEGHNKSDKTHFSFRLSSIDKVKTPLFTTEDGVDIYEGDEYYYCKRDVSFDSIVHSSIAEYPWCGSNEDYHRYFSTKEKAEEYIEENRPRYSKADIKKAAKRACPCKSGLTFWGNINTLISELEKPGSMQ